MAIEQGVVAIYRTVLRSRNDRGGQYFSRRYEKLLAQFKIRPSMSRKGNYYDNAQMESFFGTLKSELVYHCRYRTHNEAIAHIREYIESFITGREDMPVWGLYFQYAAG